MPRSSTRRFCGSWNVKAHRSSLPSRRPHPQDSSHPTAILFGPGSRFEPSPGPSYFVSPPPGPALPGFCRLPAGYAARPAGGGRAARPRKAAGGAAGTGGAEPTREVPGPPPPWRSASSSGWRTASRSWSSWSGSGCSRVRRSGEAGGGRRRRDGVSGEGPRARAARPGLLRWLISPSRRAVLRKASALEYKIQRRTLRKEDFINYIQVGSIE